MGRKKQQQNDFYFFMLEKRPQIEKKLGRVVTMAELPQHLNSEWQAMPESKKQKYKSMTERHKENKEKRDCRGLSMAELNRQDELKRKTLEDMEREIINTVDMYASGSILHEATFYIISTSYYVCTDAYKYSPAELGLVQFNFRRGIIKEYNVILKPVIPMSYGYTAKSHSEATHKLLDDDYGVDEEAVLLGLREFVNEENNKLPPLYTLEEEMEQTTAILDGITGIGHYRVYSLDKLLKHLLSMLYPEKFIPQSVAKDILTHCGLDYHPGVACEWHIAYQKDAGKYCTLSCARRWVYMMCDNMNLTGIVLEEGKHLPRAVQSCGVLVDVPRTACKDNLDETETSNASNSWFPVHDDDDNDNSGLLTSTRWRGVASSSSQRPTESAWRRRGATAGSINITQASSYTAGSAASLNSQNRDVESEEFPSLAAGITQRGAGRGRDAGIRRDAVAGRGADFGRGAVIGRGVVVGRVAGVGRGAGVGRDAVDGRGTGVGRDAVDGRDAGVGRGAGIRRDAVDGRGAGVGRGAGSAEPISNSPHI